VRLLSCRVRLSYSHNVTLQSWACPGCRKVRSRSRDISKAQLTPMKSRRKFKMSEPGQRRGRTRHRETRRPLRSGKALQIVRRLPVRLQVRAFLPAAVGHPTPRTESRSRFEDLLFRRVRMDHQLRFPKKAVILQHGAGGGS
jgi:hypothetical protein